MESKEKIKIVVAIASFAVLSIFFTAQYRKRRYRKCSQSSCYLHTEPKPQYSFKRVLADNSYSAFKHLKLGESNSETSLHSHPYEAEISALLENAEIEFSFGTESMDLKISDSYVWVETELQLKELVDVLSKQRVFAVDTEQHSLRSFLGFTALIQISTQNEDYLVDTIALHDALDVLQPVFANPSICKVFHGADNDVLWLQRDFHIYVVNLFDTAKREDWRQRPLSVEMLEYAQTDAHYLLYIANCLIAELRQHDSENSCCPDDKLRFVLEASRRSNTVCLQLYIKEIEISPGESAASSIISRHLNGQGGISSKACDLQFQDLVRRLCTWRDLMARIHDESLRYVLSDQAIIALADKVPTTQKEICTLISQADLNVDSLSSSSILPSPSPVVCSHLEDFNYLFKDKMGKLDDVFLEILQKHLGPDGSCPLSVFNYAILSKTNLKLTNRLVSKQNGIKNSRQVGQKASRELFVKKFSCKSPVYHNCRIFASDGRLLCYCDRRKLEWYVRRGLAKLVDDNPLAIMLLFEPKGRPEDEDNDFYVQSKKNICVGCGEKNHYLRYRIIPSCYRMHFPEHLKSHRSHDIVLLCVDCHEVAHSAAEKYKKKIAAEFGIPLFVQKVVDSREAQIASQLSTSEVNTVEAGVSPLQLRTAAMALLRHGPRMPSNRREELRQTVMKYYGGREITEEDLEKALLVGMSPHERKRLERKKGMSLKHSKGTGFPNKEQESNARSMGTSPIDNVLKVDGEGGLNTTKGEACGKQENGNDLEITMEVLASDSNNLSSDRSEMSEMKDTCVMDTDNCESRSQSEGTLDLFYPKSDGNASPKHNPKLSLLGHGPHGKEVVDHLLKEYGEDGIRQFCQRWRQTFVEAIHPRFLPAGWDVMHSGRRDFGEFSVYNPAKNAFAPANG
ncbi:protein RRP6-like 3 isoform X3 [Vitis riparia]|uniref:protein RRP6-like 3 isoform X3 n=1 Tax=Vitis riparia TaxID=96939 RepID=UPI00155A61DC|nr:protein RRP6-like 3 isoform X3 [Vitis riparia]